MIFVSDLGNPEAPVLLSDGSLILVEMHPDRGCITHISADGKERRDIAKTGRPNGLALDKEGALWVAESLDPPSLLTGLILWMSWLPRTCMGTSYQT